MAPPLIGLFMILLISLHLQVNSQHMSSEQAILLSLKQHWGNPHSLNSWNSTSSPCDYRWPWPHVGCTDDTVTSLYLMKENISGTIPSSICQLKNLVSIYLSDNNILGRIPVCLSNCSMLQELDLSSNVLSGTIPGEIFLMTRLRILSLNGNRLFGIIPTTIEKARSLYKPNELRSLDLSDNQLSGDIVENLEVLLNLRYSIRELRISNKFSGKIPYGFVNDSFRGISLDISNSNLCSDYRTEGLPICPSSLCSYGRFRGYLICNSSKHNEHNIFVKIAPGVAAVGVVGSAILYCLAHQIILAKCKKIWNSGSSLKEEERKMISFQRLKFNTTEILSSLTDENLIGNGGSGKVYRVFINRTGTSVAVKSILNSNISDHRLNKEFQAEIQTLGAVSHYNIVKLLCYISGNNLKLLVYEYFDNKSLDRWLHGNKREIIISSVGNSFVTKLDWPTRLNIAIGAAQGLCYMHHDCSPRIIHRDIKSSNILLDSEFNAKIADFGLAKLLNGRDDTETASAVAGTFGYIAPEYAYTSKVNTKSDVYSFGVVLLELTTGRKAVTRGDHINLGGWAQLQCRDTSATFDALDDEIKEAIYLDQIIAVFRLGVICTASSPSNRPSMKDCLHILQYCSNNCSSSSTMA